MGEVICVNFKEKRKIEQYVIKQFICASCLVQVENDSRNDDNPPYIPLLGVKGHCLCKKCFIDVYRLVKEGGLYND